MARPRKRLQWPPQMRRQWSNGARLPLRRRAASNSARRQPHRARIIFRMNPFFSNASTLFRALTGHQQHVPPPPSNTVSDSSTRSAKRIAASTSLFGKHTFGLAARFANASADAPVQKRETTKRA